MTQNPFIIHLLILFLHFCSTGGLSSCPGFCAVDRLEQTCFEGTGFVSPDDLPQSDEEDEEQAVFASVKLQSNFLTFWHPIL